MKKAILSIICATVLVFGMSSMSFAQTAIAGANVSDVSAGASATQGQEQVQGQAQDQGQTQGQMNMLGLDDIGNIKDSFNSHGMRGFAIPGEVQYGPVINYFGKPTPGVGFMESKRFIMYGGIYSEDALRSILKGSEKITCEYKMVNDAIRVPRGNTKDGVRWIKIIVQNDAVTDGKIAGWATTASDHRNAMMNEVIAAAALKALEDGCNAVHIFTEGAHRDAETSGWGIGLHSTYAKLYDPLTTQDASFVGGGGLGYSQAKAGMRDKGWIQAAGIMVPDYDLPTYLKAKPAAPKKAAAAPAPKKDEKKDEKKLPWYKRSTLM